MKKRIAAIMLVLAFGSIAFFLFQRQVGEVYLKSGKLLHEKGKPGAAALLRLASSYAYANPSAHYFLANTMQREAMATSGSNARLRLIEGESALQNALAIRTDGTALLLLGQNRTLYGNFNGALEAYNAAFFLSQKAAYAGGWNDLRRYQPEAAHTTFARGALGPSLIIVYNHFSSYTPFAPKNTMMVFLELFFKAVPPEHWIKATTDEEGPTLKTLYAAYGDSQRHEIIDALRRENFGFLADYLEDA